MRLSRRETVAAATPTVAAVILGTALLLGSATSASTPETIDAGTHSCTTDASGYCAGQPHGLGTVPVSVVTTAKAPIGGACTVQTLDADSFTATSFRIRAFKANGSALTSCLITYSYAAFSGPAPPPSSSPPASSTPASTSASPSPSPSPTSTGGVLSLPRIPWEGGPQYWAQFPKANASGWTDPAFFPINVWLSKADTAHVASLKDAGITVYEGVEHNPSIEPLSNITGQGMYAILQQDEWTPAQAGTDPGVVAWLVSDECDMGLGGCSGTEQQELADQQALAAKVRGYADARFLTSNFGNGVTRTFWSPDTMPDLIATVDASSADKYLYTSPGSDQVVADSPDWPAGANTISSAGYGWVVDQMRQFSDPTSPHPIWGGFVETSRPYLTESGARTITPAQIEGAIWSTLIHEARGISYFQHSNDPTCDGYSIVDCPTVHAAVKAIDAQVKALAPVLNTQSYSNGSRVVNGKPLLRYSFGNGTETMLKTYQNDAYIFADIGLNQSPGSKTFTVPAGVTGTTVTVVGENRTLPVSGGQFTDTFAAEYSHHTYKISL